jgi:hypothetical protein
MMTATTNPRKTSRDDTTTLKTAEWRSEIKHLQRAAPAEAGESHVSSGASLKDWTKTTLILMRCREAEAEASDLNKSIASLSMDSLTNPSSTGTMSDKITGNVTLTAGSQKSVSAVAVVEATGQHVLTIKRFK